MPRRTRQSCMPTCQRACSSAAAAHAARSCAAAAGGKTAGNAGLPLCCCCCRSRPAAFTASSLRGSGKEVRNRRGIIAESQFVASSLPLMQRHGFGDASEGCMRTAFSSSAPRPDVNFAEHGPAEALRHAKHGLVGGDCGGQQPAQAGVLPARLCLHMRLRQGQRAGFWGQAVAALQSANRRRQTLPWEADKLAAVEAVEAPPLLAMPSTPCSSHAPAGASLGRALAPLQGSVPPTPTGRHPTAGCK